MTNNSPFNVYKGGWQQLENAVFTTNQTITNVNPESIFVRPDGTQLFTLEGAVVGLYPLPIPWDVGSIPPITGDLLDTPSAPATTPTGFRFSTSGDKMFIVGEGSDTVNEYDLSVNFNVSPRSGSINSIDLSGVSETLPKGIAFSNDGTNLYVAGSSTNQIIQFPLSAPFSLASPGSPKFFDITTVTPSATPIRDVNISPDGTKLYILSDTSENIIQIKLDIPNDVESANVGVVSTFSMSVQDSTVRGITFSSDGLNLFMVGIANDNVYKYQLSNPFDITVAPQFVGQFSTLVDSTSASGVELSPDGLNLYFSGRTENRIFQYPLTNAFSITGKTNAFNVSAQDTNPQSVFFKNDGTKMFVLGGIASTLFQYDMTDNPWDVSKASFEKSNPLTGITSPNDIFFSRDGDFLYITEPTRINRFVVPSVWDIGTLSSLTFDTFGGADISSVVLKPEGDLMYLGDNTANTITSFFLSPPFSIASIVEEQVLTITDSPNSLFFRGNGKQIFTSNTTGETITKFELEEEWNIFPASHFTNLDTPSGLTLPTGIFWKPDGKRFYVVDVGSQEIRQYDIGVLSTPWNTNGSTLNGVKDVVSQIALPTSVFIRNDGLKMYVTGEDIPSNRIYEFDLGTAWDVTSANFLQNSINFTETLNGMFIKPDGKKLFVCGTSLDSVQQFTLNTEWDITTVSSQEASLSINSNANGIYFKPDGKQLYVARSAGDVTRFSLPTAWELSNPAVLEEVFSITPFPQSVFVRPTDGKQFFVIEQTNNTLTSFDMSLEFNNAMITNLGEELITDAGETLVFA